jgi:nicotinamide phosphoribosyltransferase
MATPFRTRISRLTDSYKVSHAAQYPPGTSKIYSYFESRGGKFPVTGLFGLQYILMAYLEGEVATQRDINRDHHFFASHFFGDGTLHNKAGWQRIVDVHSGRLPVRIMAAPEGTIAPNSNVLFTIENLDPQLYWLTNYIESVLLHAWSASTVMTGSRNSKQILFNALERSGDPSGLPFKLHDFGFRGVSSVETAATAGAAHLVNFMGTDTLAACDLVAQYYSGKRPEEVEAMSDDEYGRFISENMAGHSIPASEHSTMTTWGEEGEIEAFRNMLKVYPSGLVACVSDSWDIDRACSELWPSLKGEIEAREGLLVVRPDSGEPTDVVPRILGHLAEGFGYETNDKGFKVLHDQVRVIQGDGIDFDSISTILDAVMDAGFSADNIAFGSGGGLLQKVNRDTQRVAIKCSHAIIDGEEVDVFKRPKTDPTKDSKRGRLALVQTHDGLVTVDEADADSYAGGNQLIEVFNNGEVSNLQSFADIRRRAELPEVAAMSAATA